MGDTTFSQRIEQAKADAASKKQDISALNRKKITILMSPQDRRMGEIFTRLYQNPDFKAYLDYEGGELSERISNGFEKPPAHLFDSASFGEQMAFNKGRYYQILHFKAKRDTLIREYLAVMEQEKNKKEKYEN